MASQFQDQYDELRDRTARLAARNPGAFAKIMELSKRSIMVARKAEAAGDPVERRPKGWMK